MITLFHDYTSPASAVAVTRAERLRAEGVEIELVGFEAIGVDLHLPVTLDVLAELDAVAAVAEQEGVELRRPRLLPPTALAHVVERALDDDAASAWRTTCYRAFWSGGVDLADPEALRGLAATAGVDRGAVDACLEDRIALAAVRRATGERRRDGVGGVPTILAHRTLVPGLLDDDDLRALAAL
jgi:2-hydroxychromene-2-carboxylate isomerase